MSERHRQEEHVPKISPMRDEAKQQTRIWQAGVGTGTRRLVPRTETGTGGDEAGRAGEVRRPGARAALPSPEPEDDGAGKEGGFVEGEIEA